MLLHFRIYYIDDSYYDLAFNIPWGNFRGNHSSWGSFFMLFPYFI